MIELYAGNENENRMEALNYGANVLPLSFSRETSGPTGPLVYDFGEGVKSSSSSGLTKRSISPVVSGEMS